MAYFLIFLTQPKLSSLLRRRVMVEFISLCVKNSVMGKIHTNASNKMMMVIYINKICIILMLADDMTPKIHAFINYYCFIFLGYDHLLIGQN